MRRRHAMPFGAEVLAAGGSAVDAVVATAFALSVREPWNSGLGGIGFMVVTPAGSSRAEVVDFGPISPAGWPRKKLRRRNEGCSRRTRIRRATKSRSKSASGRGVQSSQPRALSWQ